MVALDHLWGAEHPTIPHIDNVVIAARREEPLTAATCTTGGARQSSVLSPFEAADFSTMSTHLSYLVISDSDIRVPYRTVTAARAEDGARPRQSGHSSGVARHGSDAGRRRKIVDVDKAGRGADGKVRAILREPYRAYNLLGLFVTVVDAAQASNLACLGVPDVDAFGECDGEQI